MSRPPKVKRPLSSNLSLAIVGLSFVIIAFFINALFTRHSDPIPEPADQIADLVIPTDKDQSRNKVTEPPDAKGVTSPNADGPMIMLKHGPVTMVSGFPSDWSIRSEGRQILITSPSKSFICQSLVIPKAEYADMLAQVDNDIVQLQHEIFSMAGTALPPTAALSVDVAQTFHEAGSVTRTGIDGIVEITAEGQTIRNTNRVVWAVGDQDAASLSCAKLKENRSEEKIILDSIQKYTFYY